MTPFELAKISKEASVRVHRPSVLVNNPPVSHVFDLSSSLSFDAKAHTPLVNLPISLSGQ